MRALILAGGYGSRLGELTKSIPKILIEVGGVPIIDRTIGKLIDIGITEITINTHYMDEMVTKYLTSRFPDLNLRIVYEPILLGTVGTLKANIDWLAVDDFIVMHADNFFADNLSELIAGELKPGNLLRACTFITKNPENCGVFIVTEENTVIDFDEKKETARSNVANAAIYRFSKNVSELVSELRDEVRDISIDFLPTITKKIELVMLKNDFFDIGTREGLFEANLAAKTIGRT